MKRLFLFLSIFLLAACGMNSEDQSSVNVERAVEPQVAQSSFAAPESESDALLSEDTTRIILKDATLRLVVQSPSESASQISGYAEENGGWVVSLNTTQFTNNAGETDTRATITVRVPAEILTATLESFKKEAVQVLSENINGRDVTAEYVDLQSRLTNLQAAESQYQTFMEDAANIPEVTTVYNELVRIRGEIEVIEGQIRYYDEASSFSSVTVELYPPDAEVELASSDDSWKPANVVEDALETLGSTLEGLGTLIIWMVVFLLPLAVLLSLPLAAGYFILRRVRKNYQRS